jgi:hypothetical protein
LRTLSHPLAYLIVIGSAVAAVLLVRTVLDWSRWVVGAAGTTVAVVGLALAGGAAVNLGVPRTCATTGAGDQVFKETNRPVISVVLGGDDCYADALGQFEILGVIVVGVSAVAVRRSALTSSPSPSPAARPE